jgi:hypothetical protein
MSQTVKDLSVTALERMLLRRRMQLERLTRRREFLQRQIEKVERQIGQIGGRNGTTLHVRRKVRRRPRNSRPLTEVVVDVLKKNKTGLPLSQLSAKVLATGYKSHSGDFKNVVYQCLYNNRKTIVHDDKAGVYKLL